MALATVTLSDADVKTLGTTPVTLIAAPGANMKIVVFGVGFASNTTNGGTTSVNANLRYATVNQILTSGFTIVTGTVSGPREGFVPSNAYTSINNSHANRAVEITGSANASSGYATTSGLEIAVLYETMSDPN